MSKNNVIEFLTFDRDNANSIVSVLRAARENARSIRETKAREPATSTSFATGCQT